MCHCGPSNEEGTTVLNADAGNDVDDVTDLQNQVQDAYAGAACGSAAAAV